ncbi:MAG: uncharacterized protein K0S27_1745 [Gammaproteobacteria bacterium]|jgi:hypothetical protein|nr:uncharacterized protein [Gammaproteobacteria bacterium]
MRDVNKLCSTLLDKFKLDKIIFSKKHGHKICVIKLVGKNISPKMTAEEILSNPKTKAGLNKEDLITITRLDMEIKLRKEKFQLVEYDRNGTVILQNERGERKTYSEQTLSTSPDLLNLMNGKDGHTIGYRVGFKNGFHTVHQKRDLGNKIK